MVLHWCIESWQNSLAPAVNIFSEIILSEAPEEEEEEETEVLSAEPELTIEEALEEKVVEEGTAEPKPEEEVEPITEWEGLAPVPKRELPKPEELEPTAER